MERKDTVFLRRQLLIISENLRNEAVELRKEAHLTSKKCLTAHQDGELEKVIFLKSRIGEISQRVAAIKIHLDNIHRKFLTISSSN